MPAMIRLTEYRSHTAPRSPVYVAARNIAVIRPLTFDGPQGDGSTISVVTMVGNAGPARDSVTFMVVEPPEEILRLMHLDDPVGTLDLLRDGT
jgi:hypothetical protein